MYGTRAHASLQLSDLHSILDWSNSVMVMQIAAHASHCAHLQALLCWPCSVRRHYPSPRVRQPRTSQPTQQVLPPGVSRAPRHVPRSRMLACPLHMKRAQQQSPAAGVHPRLCLSSSSHSGQSSRSSKSASSSRCSSNRHCRSKRRSSGSSAQLCRPCQILTDLTGTTPWQSASTSTTSTATSVKLNPSTAHLQTTWSHKYVSS